MKKRVLLSMLLGAMVIATASIFCSCDSKKEVRKIGAYELTEANGKLGIKDSVGHVILSPEFDKIDERPEWNALLADKGGLTTLVANGYVVVDGIEISGFEPVGDEGYIYIKSGAKVRLWKAGTSYLIGPFDDIRLIDDIVFLNDGGSWGAATLDHSGVAPRKYEKIIVVKNDKTRAVLVKDKSGWAMYDQDGVSDGVRYDTPSKVLEKQIKSLNIEGDIAVVKVSWPL